MGGGSKAADKANKAQMYMMQQAIAEQRAAYDEGKKMLDPYSQAGLGGLQSYLAMLGQSGDQAQQEAIAGLEQTPGYQAQLGAGQRAILQNASATGGLRGGNVQQGLAEFGSGLFGQYYQQQLDRLGQLQNQGLQTQTGLANLRAGQAANISGMMNEAGANRANSIMAGYSADQSMLGSILGAGAKLGAAYFTGGASLAGGK